MYIFELTVNSLNFQRNTTINLIISSVRSRFTTKKKKK